MAQFYSRVATTVAATIKKGAVGKAIELLSIKLTATTGGTVAITDGTTTYTIDVVAGVNEDLCWSMIFAANVDVTITPTGPTVSIFAEYIYK